MKLYLVGLVSGLILAAVGAWAQSSYWQTPNGKTYETFEMGPGLYGYRGSDGSSGQYYQLPPYNQPSRGSLSPC